MILFHRDEKTVTKVNKFNYLEKTLTADSKCTHNIKLRVRTATAAFYGIEDIVTDTKCQ